MSRKAIADEVDGTFDNLMAYAPDVIPMEEISSSQSQLGSLSARSRSSSNDGIIIQPQIATPFGQRDGAKVSLTSYNLLGRS